MMAASTGESALTLSIQSKEADNLALRGIMAQNQVRLERIGDSDTLLVNLP